MHSTDSLDDGYLGSGTKRIWNSCMVEINIVLIYWSFVIQEKVLIKRKRNCEHMFN
jgi:hypothetical protein